ncbi:putative GATA-type domain-containing protein [Seiridium cardinale]|uniref:GATA-type domain-containing protein n=1 Tax=Seiridium cardinale TaxID=138064 RepID=A0ABR2Y679_9PEZI
MTEIVYCLSAWARGHLKDGPDGLNKWFARSRIDRDISRSMMKYLNRRAGGPDLLCSKVIAAMPLKSQKILDGHPSSPLDLLVLPRGWWYIRDDVDIKDNAGLEGTRVYAGLSVASAGGRSRSKSHFSNSNWDLNSMSDDAIYQLGAHVFFAARDDVIMNHKLVDIFRNNCHDNEDVDDSQSDPGAVVILLEALIMTYLGQFLDGLNLPNFSLQSLNSAWSVQQADINCIFSLIPPPLRKCVDCGLGHADGATQMVCLYKMTAGRQLEEFFRCGQCDRYIFRTGVPRTDHLERYLAIKDRACIGCGMTQADGAKEWRYSSAAQRGDKMRCSRCHYAANRPINVRVTGRLMAIEYRVYIDCGKTQATSVMCWYAEFSNINQLGTTDLVITTLSPKHNTMTK